MFNKTNREIIQLMEDFRDDDAEELKAQGGNPDMIANFGFENAVQAFHGGQIHGINEFLSMVAEALGRADAGSTLQEER